MAACVVSGGMSCSWLLYKPGHDGYSNSRLLDHFTSVMWFTLLAIQSAMLSSK